MKININMTIACVYKFKIDFTFFFCNQRVQDFYIWSLQGILTLSLQNIYLILHSKQHQTKDYIIINGDLG